MSSEFWHTQTDRRAALDYYSVDEMQEGVLIPTFRSENLADVPISKLVSENSLPFMQEPTEKQPLIHVDEIVQIRTSNETFQSQEVRNTGDKSALRMRLQWVQETFDHAETIWLVKWL